MSESACDVGMIDQFVSLFGQIGDQGREHLTAAMVALVDGNPEAIEVNFYQMKQHIILFLL